MKIEPPQDFGRDLEAMSFAHNYHQWIFDEFQPFLGQHLLEVGAGTGDFAQLLLQSEPLSLTVVEPSANMFPLLEEKLQNELQTIKLQAVFGDIYQSLALQPDTIIYVNVLEHIGEDKLELTYIYETLPIDGHVCLFVPALQWLYGTADENLGHFRRYSKKSLESLVQEVGFTLVKSRYFDIIGILPWWILFCLLKRQAVNAGQISMYDKIVIPLMRKIENKISVPLGKNILMIGKKGTGLL